MELGQWVERAKAALRAGEPRAALALLGKIEAARPGDPIWPRRQADIHRRLGDVDAELQALVRTSRLQVDAGEVVQAIATCRQILEIDDQHTETLDRLHLLYMVPQNDAGSDPSASRSASAPRSADSFAPSEPPARPESPEAPLAELLLTETLPGARRVDLADPEQGGVAEIPLDSESDLEPDLDLQLSALDSQGRPREPSSWSSGAGFGGDSTQSYLLKCALLGALEPAELRELLRKVEMRAVAAGEVVFRQGDRAERLFVVVEGAVVPIAESDSRVRMGVLECGDFFGEIGLLSDQPRNATVEALVDSRLLAIDRPLMWSLLRRHPEALRVLLRTLRERLVDRLIRTSPLFAAFAAAKRSAVAKQFGMLEVRADTVLLEQGHPNQGLFVVLAGQLDVVERSPHGDKIVASLEHGDVFGEMSMLSDAAANARVVSRSKCWLVCLSNERFRRLALTNPGLSEFVRDVARSRRQENRERSAF